MGNDLQTTSANIHEPHTEGEEQPLATATSPRTTTLQVPITDVLSSTECERTIDDDTHKLNCVTHINHKWNVKPNANHFAQVIIHNDNTRMNQLSDCWDVIDPNKNEYISFNDALNNTIYLKPRSKHHKQWISCFGTKIVTKGEYKRWQIKILPANNKTSTKYMHKMSGAKVMIGIVDTDTLAERERGTAIDCEYWKLPYFGYGFNGDNGKKYHISKKGASYSRKYKVGDVITVELNRTQNRFVMHNDLRFYTNERADGLAFSVDNDRNYVLAMALCSDKYQIQISD